MESEHSRAYTDSRLDLYHVNGLYFGFVQHDTIYDSDGRYCGWVEADGSVWRADGVYAGELDRAGYVLRDPARAETPARLPRAPMPDLAVRLRPAHRGSYAPPAGRVDALRTLEGRAE